jgi:hypothetical protein
MSMHNTETDFYGKQTDEKILYVVHPHPLATIFNLVKICSIAIIVSLALIVIGKQIESIGGLFITMGIVLFLLIIVIGIKIVLDWESREIAYITDRRLVRFEPTTLFATNSRTLTWDEVVKVKTYPSNFVFKQMAIGNIIVHARTSIRTAEDTPIDTVTADDIEIKDVYFYRDLGNYIDKILFTYKQKPLEINSIKPFVLKPKGERY